MAHGRTQHAVNALEVGWAELRQAHWAAALAFFQKAVTQEESAEAYEGLSWAAWWLDHADIVFDARAHAYHLYKQRSDPAAAARMATWLACDQLDFRGATSVASGWLARAHRLLEPLPPGPEHGWLAFFEGYIAQASGDTAHARQLASRARELGRRHGVADLEMLGLALEGSVLVALAHVEEGMRCLDESTAAALDGEAVIPISSAWACCFLVTACSAIRDFGRAAQWCDRIAEFAQRYGSRYMLAFCRAEYGAVHLWRGEWSEAECMLEASVQDFSQSRPAFVAAPLVALAELRRRQGRLKDAASLLDRAGASAPAQVCRARLALDGGDTLRAVELSERLLRQTPLECKVELAPALEVLIRARIARGELEQARAGLATLREIAHMLGTPPLRASADLAEGMLAAASGDHERARPLLEDAADGFERSGGPFEAAHARLELATSLSALRRSDAAEREARAALQCLLDLGALADAARARRLLDAANAAGGPGQRITPRERDVLGLLVEGCTNRQIADRLVVSEHTVHRHVTSILRKLDLPSRTAATALALRTGLVEPPRT